MKWERPSLGNVLTLLSMAGGLVLAYASMAADLREAKSKVEALEQRAAEDRRDAKATRREIKEELKEVKQDGKDTKEVVQQILIKLERMERRQR